MIASCIRQAWFRGLGRHRRGLGIEALAAAQLDAVGCNEEAYTTLATDAKTSDEEAIGEKGVSILYQVLISHAGFIPTEIIKAREAVQVVPKLHALLVVLGVFLFPRHNEGADTAARMA